MQLPRHWRSRAARAPMAATVSLSLLFGASCDVPPDPAATATQQTEAPFRTFWFGVDHNDITEDGLSMLSSSVAEAIGDRNEETDSGDTKKRNDYHFDNCSIAESFDEIRANYGKLLDALDPAQYRHSDSLKLFGRILHTMQDFYAHSNWVEQGERGLLNEGTLMPPPVTPGSWLGGLVVLQAGVPETWFVDRATQGEAARRPWIWDGSDWYPALITGTYEGNTGGSTCHPNASIYHGDHTSQGDVHEYLAKDDPDSFMHEEAVDFATWQTTEEFCRLDRMVFVRYGQSGWSHFRSKWKVKQAKMDVACPANTELAASLAAAGATTF